MSDSAVRRIEASIVDDERDGERNEITVRGEKGKQKRNFRKLVHGYRKGINKATRVVQFPYRKFQKLFNKDPRAKEPRSGSCSSSSNYRSAEFNSSSTRVGNSSHSNNYSFCFTVCLSKPRTLDLEFEGSENAADPELGYEYMKDLIENNDFYSRECNAHIIIDD